MLIKCIPVGQIETNCYIVTDENTLECAIIDPGDESNAILDYIEDRRLKPKYIFLTHGHYLIPNYVSSWQWRRSIRDSVIRDGG